MIGLPLHLNNLQKIGRILLADVLLFEAPVFGGCALDGDLDRVVAVAAVDGGNLILSTYEKDLFLNNYPNREHYIRKNDIKIGIH